MMKTVATLLLAMFLLTGNVLAEQEAPQSQQADKTQKEKLEEPRLSDLIPAASALAVRLSEIESQLLGLPEGKSINKQFIEIDARIIKASQQFEKLQRSKAGQYAIVFKLQQDLAYETEVLTRASQPVKSAIQQLDEWHREWHNEKLRWNDWQTFFLQQRSFNQLDAVFANAHATINDAQRRIRQHINATMEIQARGAAVQNRLDELDAELRSLITKARKEFVLGTSPPMYTAEYYSQYDMQLLQTGWQGLKLISWSDSQFFVQHAVVYCLVLLVFFMVTTGIFRHRETLRESERLSFIAHRPVATALFICSLLTALHLEFWEAPTSIQLMNIVIGGFACVRLLVYLLKQPWQKYAAYSAMISFILVMLMIASGLPVSLFRMYTLIISLLGIRFCMQWASQSSKLNEPTYYALTLRLLALLFSAILIAEFWGKAGVATYLLVSSLKSMAIILPVILFVYMIRAFTHWLFFSSSLWQIKLMRNDAAEFAQKISFLIQTLVVLFILLPAILATWKVFDTIPEAINSLLAPGFYVGTDKISIGVIAASIVILYVSSLTSRILPKVLLDEQVSGRKIERGVRHSVSRLMQYFIVFLGFMVVLATIGLDLTKLTIMVSAFGIGIGFGLQSIVSNFVSGLILLFERPLREDDTIEINNERAQIKKIGLRSTIVKTMDEAEVIIPNADLINNPVTNWTLSNREARLRMPVGVAYGSDVPLVEQTLMECAKANDEVVSSPTPQVLFVNFGESSLDFEVRVWVKDDDARMRVKSELYHHIERRFRELNIAIPFPQRDLHLRTIDAAAMESAAQLPAKGIITQENPQ